MTCRDDQPNTMGALSRRLKGEIAIAGVGNVLRADDGAGPRLVEMLRGRLDRDRRSGFSTLLLDCGETPENYIGLIAQLGPDTVLVVDSASLGLPPGEMRVIEAGDLSKHSSSTHRMSPALFMNRLKEETCADVFMLAVQPATTAFGEDLSPFVGCALTKLGDVIQGVIGQSEHEA